MIEVVPGFNYFLVEGSGKVFPRLNEINKWLNENDMGERVTSTGWTIYDRTYTFKYEEDAIAFKLRFGI